MDNIKALRLQVQLHIAYMYDNCNSWLPSLLRFLILGITFTRDCGGESEKRENTHAMPRSTSGIPDNIWLESMSSVLRMVDSTFRCSGS
jgi:hypothetical protein